MCKFCIVLAQKQDLKACMPSIDGSIDPLPRQGRCFASVQAYLSQEWL